MQTDQTNEKREPKAIDFETMGEYAREFIKFEVERQLQALGLLPKAGK